MSLQQAIQATERAEALITSVTSSERLWFKALVVAKYAKHPACDALFVVLAETLDCPLVTWDKKTAAQISTDSRGAWKAVKALKRSLFANNLEQLLVFRRLLLGVHKERLDPDL
ncbi:type II toxin-antitoxin system VapC family toxin [Endozoicomonas sp. ONNA2]|uniref:type II toxin-antitoxin system VapC family toxin n=1 Tax=Endozoicomonas sp. ONNA2 TaxID=2828741 RepID=UPI002147A00B|nr:type II toxin-antitoxin system VapC family toxin [Endozoicomonas sp. ONNA2]